MPVLAPVLLACLIPFSAPLPAAPLLAAPLSAAPLPQTGRPKRVPRKGKIELPAPKPRPPKPKAAPRVRNDVAQFQRDVFRMRRSRHLPTEQVEGILRQLREDYDAPAQMALRLAGKVDPNQLHGVMHVLKRYGDTKDAEELHFLLLTRSMGAATQVAVRTMAWRRQRQARMPELVLGIG